jgi:predicted transcriptional regulator YdeE
VNGALAFDLRYGLDRLAALLEPPAAPRYSITHEGARDISPCRYVYKTYSGPIKTLAMSMPALLSELQQQLASRNVQPCGAPIAVYLKTNIKLRTTVCQVGLPVADADIGDLPVREIPAHRAFVVTLRGNSSALEIAWYQAMQRLTQESIRPDQRMAPFERYHGGLGAAEVNHCVTELHIPMIVT